MRPTPHRLLSFDPRLTSQRLAAFLWALYALPTPQLSAVAWRFGSPAQLSALPARSRGRIEPGMQRGGRFATFTDMDAMNALKMLSRSRELPPPLRLVWAAGFRRPNCTQLNRVGRATTLWNGSVHWMGGVPHHGGAGLVKKRPYCFVHLQGPTAKARCQPQM